MRPHFTCPCCGTTSYHPDDVLEGYCGVCHDFTRDAKLTEIAREVTDEVLGEGVYDELNGRGP